MSVCLHLFFKLLVFCYVQQLLPGWKQLAITCHTDSGIPGCALSSFCEFWGPTPERLMEVTWPSLPLNLYRRQQFPQMILSEGCMSNPQIFQRRPALKEQKDNVPLSQIQCLQTLYHFPMTLSIKHLEEPVALCGTHRRVLPPLRVP